MAAQAPKIAASRKGAEGAVLVSAMVVLAIYSYRKLLEPATINPKTTEPLVRQVLGAEPKPAPVPTFALAYSFVFFTLSVGAVAAPELAAAFAILVAVGYTLTNGGAMFVDISRGVGGGALQGEGLGKLVSRKGPAQSSVGQGGQATFAPLKTLPGAEGLQLAPSQNPELFPKHNTGVPGEAHG